MVAIEMPLLPLWTSEFAVPLTLTVTGIAQRRLRLRGAMRAAPRRARRPRNWPTRRRRRRWRSPLRRDRSQHRRSGTARPTRRPSSPPARRSRRPTRTPPWCAAPRSRTRRRGTARRSCRSRRRVTWRPSGSAGQSPREMRAVRPSPMQTVSVLIRFGSIAVPTLRTCATRRPAAGCSRALASAAARRPRPRRG